jgi:hypothetical protein
MIDGDRKFCDGCGQPLPAGSKLSRQTVTKTEADDLRASVPMNDDGTVTLDLCLQCRILRAERRKRETAK